MKKLNDYLTFYQQHHQKKATKITHFFGIPMVMIGLLIGLQWLQLTLGGKYAVNLNVIFVVATLVFYAYLDIAFAGVMFAIILIPMILIYLITPISPTLHSMIAFAVFFIGGWILQFMGHAFEGKRPAFTDNLLQLIIAPLFLIVELMESKFAEKFMPKLSSWLLLRIGKHKDAKF